MLPQMSVLEIRRPTAPPGRTIPPYPTGPDVMPRWAALADDPQARVVLLARKASPEVVI